MRSVSASHRIENSLTCHRIINEAQSAKHALLRGQDVAASVNLGQISNQLEVASELGVPPTPAPRESTSTPSSSVSQGVSPITVFHPSPITPNHVGISNMQMPAAPTIAEPAPSHANSLPALLPPLPVDSVHRVSTGQPGLLATPPMHQEPASGDLLSPPTSGSLQPPPLIHSHSFPNGHQLPSQLHGLTPSTPLLASSSFAAVLGIGHAPMISSPLAAMPVSRPPSPPRPYPIQEQHWAETQAASTSTVAMQGIPELHRTASELPIRRPSLIDGRADGRPVVNRTRSTSVNKFSLMPSMTTSMPPTSWNSRHVSPDDEDDGSTSEEEGPKRLKRRRSSAARDKEDAPDISMANLISEDIRRQLDQIFEQWLNHICSDCE